MLCVTGKERDIFELKKRLEVKGVLHEIRLDYLDTPDFDIQNLNIDPKGLIVTLRPRREMGIFIGSEEERCQILERFIKQGVGYVDVEISTDSDHLKRLCSLAERYNVKVILSSHSITPLGLTELRRLLEKIYDFQPFAAKVAMTVEDTSDLDVFLQIDGKRTKILIGMGYAGILSRVLYNKFGSYLTYVASNKDNVTAHGQMTLSQVMAWGLINKDDPLLFVLMGGAQVIESPGPHVYNSWFVEKDINAIYLPVITMKPKETLDLLLKCNLRGASITMPLKEAMATYLDEKGVEVMEIGVVNTITVLSNGRIRGDLTDGDGAISALKNRNANLDGASAVVIGSGATAKAITYSLLKKGANVTIVARNKDRLQMMAQKFNIKTFGLESLTHIPFSILINTTPVGSSDADQPIVENKEILRGKIVLDVVIKKETRLLKDTKEVGGIAVSGVDMWVQQGVLQVSRWFEESVKEEEIRRHLPEWTR